MKTNFKFYIILVFTLILFAHANSQTIYLSGDIAESQFFECDTIILEGSIFIPDTVSVIIAPGTKVLSDGYKQILVAGSLVAIGNSQDSILFSVMDTTGFADTTQYEAGGWDGIHILDSECEDSLIFEYCSFSYGKAISPYNDEGGLFYIQFKDNMRIKNCSFTNNMCLNTGGALYAWQSSPEISNNYFYHNISYMSGGGLAFNGALSAPQIISNTFIKNYAQYNNSTGGEGAGIYISTGMSTMQPRNPLIMSNTFIANTRTAVYESCQDIIISNNIFIANYGAIDNGITIGEGKVTNNVIYGNYGSVIIASSPYFCIRNNIINNNTGRWELHPSDHDNSELIWEAMPSNIDLKYCNIDFGLYSENEGVSWVDPKFINPPNVLNAQEVYDYMYTPNSINPFEEYEIVEYDLSLSSESLLINAGTPDTTGLLIPTVDFIGMNRVFQNRIDMGAYEYQSLVSNTHIKKDSEFHVFPNPAKDILFLSSVYSGGHYAICNINGKIILKGNKTINGINIKNLTPGMYVFHYYFNNTEHKGKFIKL